LANSGTVVAFVNVNDQCNTGITAQTLMNFCRSVDGMASLIVPSMGMSLTPMKEVILQSSGGSDTESNQMVMNRPPVKKRKNKRPDDSIDQIIANVEEGNHSDDDPMKAGVRITNSWTLATPKQAC
jgi:hypothetical protein